MRSLAACDGVLWRVLQVMLNFTKQALHDKQQLVGNAFILLILMYTYWLLALSFHCHMILFFT